MAEVEFLNEEDRNRRIAVDTVPGSTIMYIDKRTDSGSLRSMWTEREAMALHALLGEALYGDVSPFVENLRCPA